MKKLLLIVALGALCAFLFFPRTVKDVLDYSMSHTQKIDLSGPLEFFSNVSFSQTHLTSTGVFELTNAERVNNGAKPVTINAKLNAAALQKAQDMLAKQYFEHESPDGKGPADLAHQQKYDYLIVGENLAMGNFKDDAELIDAWMKSPGHRANIVNKSYEEIGVAVIKGEFEGRMVWMAVQEFGVPASSCVAVDSELKAHITANKTEIAKENIALQERKNRIDSMSPKSGKSYNDEVDAYNAAVVAFKRIVEQTPKLIATYNAQVTAYNSCVTSK